MRKYQHNKKVVKVTIPSNFIRMLTHRDTINFIFETWYVFYFCKDEETNHLFLWSCLL